MVKSNIRNKKDITRRRKQASIAMCEEPDPLPICGMENEEIKFFFINYYFGMALLLIKVCTFSGRALIS